LPAARETPDGRNCPGPGRETTAGGRLNLVSTRLATPEITNSFHLQPIFSIPKGRPSLRPPRPVAFSSIADFG
jgi:hypothetical protein